MEIKHGQVYVDEELVGWATYIEEPFSHTIRALLYFLIPESSQHWDRFELQVTVRVDAKQYLQCANIRKLGAVTLDGRVWKEYLISYEEEVNETAPSRSQPAPG
ncbi:MAG: hypothetical protein HY644_03175 [Acidobacteria bacterium]|nr:hypothetical protein [Acidobacteriota bacterium]